MVGVGVGVDCGSGGPALRSVKECTAPRLLWHATIKQWTRGHQSLLVLSLTHAVSTGYPWYCGGTSIIGVSRDRHSTSAKKKKNLVPRLKPTTLSSTKNGLVGLTISPPLSLNFDLMRTGPPQLPGNNITQQYTIVIHSICILLYDYKDVSNEKVGDWFWIRSVLNQFKPDHLHHLGSSWCNTIPW